MSSKRFTFASKKFATALVVLCVLALSIWNDFDEVDFASIANTAPIQQQNVNVASAPVNAVVATSTQKNASLSVVKVVDGDTIDVKNADGKIQRVRFIGINAPESVDPRKKVECFGKEASAETHALLEGKSVVLTADPTQQNIDKYGRLLRYVSLEDGTDVNQKMLTDGFAHEYTYAKPYERQTAYRAAEKDAREQKRGLWADGACVK